MSLSSSHIVPGRREDVWDWHTRPGAVQRLTPPFIPLTPIQQAHSLKDGTTIFSLPAGLRWEARHDLSGYVKGFSFTDVCLNAPIKALSYWRHTHSFLDASTPQAVATKITDDVHTRVPASTLAPMFAYRQQQLIGDLNFAQRIQGLSAAKLTVAITGSSGLIGTALRAQLTTLGHKVIQFVRPDNQPAKIDPATMRIWDPLQPNPDLLHGVDVVVHLAGAPIFGRFTEAHKQSLWQSRITPTQELAKLIAAHDQPITFIAGSSIGYYGHDRTDEVLTETAASGTGFLADLTKQWEAAANLAQAAHTRVVNLRTGIVLSGRGGFLPVLRTLFSAGLGGHLSTGEQGFSWIALDDLTDIIITAALDDALEGPLNATAPTPVTNAQMAQDLGAQLNRPAWFPIPTIGAKAILGSQGTEEFALADQHVIPDVLLKRNHYFRYPTLSAAFAHELGNETLFDAPVQPLSDPTTQPYGTSWLRLPKFF